jgi:hypothetical protein
LITGGADKTIKVINTFFLLKYSNWSQWFANRFMQSKHNNRTPTYFGVVDSCNSLIHSVILCERYLQLCLATPHVHQLVHGPLNYSISPGFRC